MTSARLRFLVVPWLIACARTAAGVERQPTQRGLLPLRNVGVVDVGAGAVLERRTLVVEGVGIRSIGGDGEVPAAAESIKGTGKFLIPGLWTCTCTCATPALQDCCSPI